ncbi:sugar phosphate isomerase/epimerase [Kiritimatiellaeota bacterium B1221]|nr:sugar phosphate isomerase/epimerase [Kiritimatiellaeota bacterium B1221]
MIKSISYWSMPGGLEGRCSIEDAARFAKATGFSGLELCIAETGLLTPASDRKTCEGYRKIVLDEGLILESLASGMSWGCSPTHPDPAIRQKAIQLHQDALYRAAWLGCTSLLFVPGAVKILWNPDYDPVPYDQAVEWAREAIHALLPVAETVGVDLCIENVWNGMFYSPIELADFVDSFNHPKLGIYLDVGNLPGIHQHPPHWIDMLGSRIRRVHIKDYNCEVGGMDGFCDLLQGDVPFPEIMAALKRNGYDRTIVAEMMPPNKGLLERTGKAMDRILA